MKGNESVGGCRECAHSFEFGTDLEILKIGGVRDLQDVGTATDLAVLYVTLIAPCQLIDRSLVPFAAARALEARIHGGILVPNKITSASQRIQRGAKATQAPCAPLFPL
jgi:hypothetical protein